MGSRGSSLTAYPNCHDLFTDALLFIVTLLSFGHLTVMTTPHPESTVDFEFIQTPAASVQSKPAFDCGVPTTLVSNLAL